MYRFRLELGKSFMFRGSPPSAVFLEYLKNSKWPQTSFKEKGRFGRELAIGRFKRGSLRSDMTQKKIPMIKGPKKRKRKRGKPKNHCKAESDGTS